MNAVVATAGLRIAPPRLATVPPLSLYVHIPWCVRKCPYCDFNSHESRGPLPEARYVNALIADLEAALPLIWGRRVHTVFFGGGTPSLLSSAALDTILSAVRALLPLPPDAEITLEANPGTFEVAKFAAFRKLGVNRLSIGIQSFNPAHLRALGRIHDAAEAVRAIEIARSEFDNFNLDLMYALPGQTLSEALADIHCAVQYAPRHISAYHLTLEPNTLFHRFPPQLPDHDAAAAMQAGIESELARAGYRQYETSAFCMPGGQAKHNVNYWQFGDYLGIGAGAHSKISSHERIVRQIRHKHPQAYLEKVAAGSAVMESNDVGSDDLSFEFMMNALRLTEGFAVRLFEERTGLPLALLHKDLEIAEARGLINRDHLHIAPSELGRRFLNDLLQIFLHD